MSLNATKAQGNDYFLTRELLVALLVLIITIGKLLNFFYPNNYLFDILIYQTISCIFSIICLVEEKP
jgi:hypothetical protein